MAAKKSEKRQRNEQIKIRCTANEFNAIAAKSSASGLTTAAYARATLLGDAGPRAQRRLPVDAQILRQVLAQFGRYGNNLNQLAHYLNAGESVYPLLPEMKQVMREWGDLRDTILEALGKSARPA